MNTITGITQRPYGSLRDGTAISEFILTNTNGLIVNVINYGGIITSVRVPDQNGKSGDIVLGYASLEDYLQGENYLGCIVGRHAGRIKNAALPIEDLDYLLTANAGPHQLHGGTQGWDKKCWLATPFSNDKGVGLELTYESVDGEEGYPGNVFARMSYYLTHTNSLVCYAYAETDKQTCINMTQHSYWNLSGGETNISQHGLQILGDNYLPVDTDNIPTGEFRPVINTPFDFREPAWIGNALNAEDEQIRLANGLDHCWRLNNQNGKLSHAATLYDPGSGRLMELHTTAPGLQIYTGQGLSGQDKNGRRIMPFGGIALEAQGFPDAPHHPHFPSTLVAPGKPFQSVTAFVFSTFPYPG